MIDLEKYNSEVSIKLFFRSFELIKKTVRIV